MNLEVKHGVKKQLCKEFNCQYKTVQMALSGMTKTELANKIRSKAVELSIK